MVMSSGWGWSVRWVTVMFSVMVMSFATLSGSDRVRVLAIEGCQEFRTRSFLFGGCYCGCYR